ncbi:MAG: hypothetical protein ACC656_04270 [Candidatus Heimdallarchaeota archaeon]
MTLNLRFPPITILLVGLSASVFFFLQDQDVMAVDVLFIGLYLTLFFYFILKILFYFKYKATLNELFFYLFVNIIVIVVLVFGSLTSFMQNPYYSFTISVISVNSITSDTFNLYITAISLLVLPFLLISSALQLRSFTKYEFIRYTPTSAKGINAEWLAIVIFFVAGSLFTFVSSSTGDFLAFFYGMFYLLLGVGFLLGK